MLDAEWNSFESQVDWASLTLHACSVHVLVIPAVISPDMIGLSAGHGHRLGMNELLGRRLLIRVEDRVTQICHRLN